MTESEGPGDDPPRFAWRMLRPPPAIALVFGALYGAVAGAIVAWDIAVLIRFGRAVRERIRRARGDDEAELDA